MSNKALLAVLGASLSLGVASQATASSNPFQSEQLSSGYANAAKGVQVADAKMNVEPAQAEKKAEGKCGEGKCGEKKDGDKKDGEGKCGEGKCGG